MSLDTLSVGDPVDLAQAVACLALLVGKVGRRGCGLHILGEKVNSQGALDMGLLPGYLPGYGSLADAQVRGIFEEAWQTSLPETRGLDARGILEGCLDGTIRSLYIVGENPVGTYPDRVRVEKALEEVEFLVVQDLFLTDTAKKAHVVLPVASFAEKDGTYTSVDRRIQRVNRAIPPPDGLRSDLEIFCELARSMGSAFPYRWHADVLEEIGRVVSLYRGIRWNGLPGEGLAWPVRGERAVNGSPVLYAEAFPNSKARFELRPWEEPTHMGDTRSYPWILRPQTSWFHSGTFSTWSPTLMEVSPGPKVILHWNDARDLQLRDGDRARVISPHGTLEAPIQTRPRGPRGVVQVPHHFPSEPLNRLVGWGDKIVRVRVEKIGD
jgi:predicted molibdopterin-dependent oxidoreductase YjgC